jgi:hypothetical protein
LITASTPWEEIEVSFAITGTGLNMGASVIKDILQRKR